VPEDIRGAMRIEYVENVGQALALALEPNGKKAGTKRASS